MDGRFFPRVLFGLLAVALIVGVGVYAYQLGLAQAGVAAGTGAVGPAMGPYFWHPRPFFFGGFGCLVPLFFLFVFFGLMRMMFWRGHWMGRGGWRRGPWSEDGVPPMFEEWHKRAHEQKAEPAEGPKPDVKPGK